MKKLSILLIPWILSLLSCSVSPNSILQLENCNDDLIKLWIQGKENIEIPGKIYFPYIPKYQQIKLSIDDGQKQVIYKIEEIPVQRY